MGGTPIAGMNRSASRATDSKSRCSRRCCAGAWTPWWRPARCWRGGTPSRARSSSTASRSPGRSHPDRIWRNGGARPGDLLVLTKPLGSGVVTTAARAELARPEELATAVRWMATLNRDAAAAAATVEPRMRSPTSQGSPLRATPRRWRCQHGRGRGVARRAAADAGGLPRGERRPGAGGYGQEPAQPRRDSRRRRRRRPYQGRPGARPADLGRAPRRLHAGSGRPSGPDSSPRPPWSAESHPEPRAG